MVVYYRLCGIKSTNPSPIYQEDKHKLNRICLESFVMAYKDIKPTMVFLCDFCPDSYRQMIEEVIPKDWKGDIRYTNIGINETCLLQYELFDNENEEYVLFQECDYYHIGPITTKMIDSLGFVSPYDHPDKYDLNEKSTLKIADGHHFKTTISTTSTFATTRTLYKRYRDLFYKFGYLDHQRWVEINEMGGVLYTPIPTLATHMVEKYLSPGIEWKNLFSAL